MTMTFSDPRTVGPRIRMMMPHLTPLEARVVDMCLGSRQFDETTWLKTVADDAKVSEAMIVKIAKKLGFSGFKEFRSGIVDYNRLPTADLHQEISPDDTGPEVAQKVFPTSIHALEESPGPYEDAIRITDRFFGTQLRGFDIRGIAPRILRENYNADGTISEKNVVSDALGGRAYYMGRIELELPTSSSLRSFGLRPSAFVDVGSVWGLKSPELVDVAKVCQAAGLENKQIPGGSTDLSCTQFNTGGVTAYSDANSVTGVRERFVGNSARPRLSRTRPFSASSRGSSSRRCSPAGTFTAGADASRCAGRSPGSSRWCSHTSEASSSSKSCSAAS